MATVYDVIEKAGGLRDALQARLDGGLPDDQAEIVEGLLDSLIPAIERFSAAHPAGDDTVDAGDHLVAMIDGASAKANGPVPALEAAVGKVLTALG
jgi:hypothetical protein